MDMNAPWLEKENRLLKNWQEAKERLFLAACPTQEAEAKDLVRETIGPVSLVPRVLVETHENKEDEEVISFGVARYLLDAYGVTEKRLLEITKEKAAELFPPVYTQMGKLTIVTTLCNGLAGFPFGAAGIFYPGAMKRMRKVVGKDYYILPSSRSEVILVSRTDFGSDMEEGLLHVVERVNSLLVEEGRKDEKLGDFVLSYFNGEVSVV